MLWGRRCFGVVWSSMGLWLTAGMAGMFLHMTRLGSVGFGLGLGLGMYTLHRWLGAAVMVELVVGGIGGIGGIGG
ncbi:hypothetical protein BZA77DRAFT_323910 [Pyronema omphalodes]|nr:hypothetical protein BZA77DRAFT_323910 [Pyronema omphalodes]